MFSTRCAALLLVLLPVTASHSCGGGYTQLPTLFDTDAVESELIEGTFDFEATRLLPAQALGRDWEEESRWRNGGVPSTSEFEQQELGDAYAKVQAMRSAIDDAGAWQAGEGVAIDVRLYTAGARAFKVRDYATARGRFKAVLALPAAESESRARWAQFMLARIGLAELRANAADAGAAGPPDPSMNQYPSSDDPTMEVLAIGDEAKADDVAAAFAQLRADVAAEPAHRDPLALVRASYGEEAAVALLRRDFARAARLYAQQAALGSWSGKASLRVLARRLLRSETDLQLAMREPLLQRLISAYLYSGGDTAPGYGDGYYNSELLSRYFAAIDHLDDAVVAGADQFAAAAYRIGSYALAARLVEHNDSPLALWVRAKLALRAGDTVAAEAALEKSAATFRANPGWGFEFDVRTQRRTGLDPACRVDAERAVLLSRRGQSLPALHLLVHNTGPYWPETATVAQTNLSLEQLQQFVDGEAEKPAANVQESDSGQLERLRTLLGRRLLNAQHYTDVDKYFSGELRDVARSYAAGMAAVAVQTGVSRGEARFQAATQLALWGRSLLQPDHAGVDAVEFTDVYFYRRKAAALANQAADDLPRRSQAFAAVLCHATGWLLLREPDNARIYYRRYLRQGAYMDWAGDFGRSCPAPDFAAAAAIRQRRKAPAASLKPPAAAKHASA